MIGVLGFGDARESGLLTVDGYGGGSIMVWAGVCLGGRTYLYMAEVV